MKHVPLLASSAALCLFLLPLLTPSCGGSTTTPPTPTGAGAGSTGSAGSSAAGGAGSVQQGGAAGTMVTTETCVADSDCEWGEVPHEILMASDCICLYGCVYLPQTKITAARRGAQYKALCNPQTNGKGQPCGIDDCARPGAIACVDGVCKAAPRDGGLTQ